MRRHLLRRTRQLLTDPDARHAAPHLRRRPATDVKHQQSPALTRRRQPAQPIRRDDFLADHQTRTLNAVRGMLAVTNDPQQIGSRIRIEALECGKIAALDFDRPAGESGDALQRSTSKPSCIVPPRQTATRSIGRTGSGCRRLTSSAATTPPSVASSARTGEGSDGIVTTERIEMSGGSAAARRAGSKCARVAPSNPGPAVSSGCPIRR